MAPADADENLVLALGPKSKLPHADGFLAACVDGSVHFLHANLPVSLRRALITIAGKESVVDINQ